MLSRFSIFYFIATCFRILRRGLSYLERKMLLKRTTYAMKTK